MAELFHGTDTFVAIISNVGTEKLLEEEKDDFDEMQLTKMRNRKKSLSKPSKYDIIKGEG